MPSRNRHKGCPFRQPAQEQGTLGTLHGRDGFHHIPGNTDDPDMLRHIGIHTIRENDSIQTGAVFDCLFQQLGAVSGKQACFLSRLSGRKKLLYLLQLGIFTGSDSLFCHSFFTASRE